MWMTFWGSFFGFAFGIALFYFSEKIKHWLSIKNKKKYFVRELKYNLNLINQWEKDIESLNLKVATDNIDVYIYLNYSDYQRAFTQDCFTTGILYDKLNDEEIANLNKVLYHFSFSTENYVNNKINSWKNNKIENKNEISNIVEFQKNSIPEFKKIIQNILNKF